MDRYDSYTDKFLRDTQYGILDTDVPDTNVGDMISRAQAIAAIEGTDWYTQNKNKDMVQGAHDKEDAWYKAQDVYKVLEDLPPAEPEIIRCKECDWWTKQEDSLQGRCELMRMYPTGSWFCANAKRRQED